MKARQQLSSPSFKCTGQNIKAFSWSRSTRRPTDSAKNLDCTFAIKEHHTKTQTDRYALFPYSDECVEKKCDFYFHLENSVFFENLDALRLLVEQNRKVLAPHLTGDDQLEKNSKDLGVFGHFCTDKVNVIKKFDQ